MNHSRPTNLAIAQSGHYDLWPSPDYHIMHCLYQWRRLHLAVLERRYIDEHVYMYDHTLHCTRLIMRWKDDWQHGSNWTTKSEHSMF